MSRTRKGYFFATLATPAYINGDTAKAKTLPHRYHCKNRERDHVEPDDQPNGYPIIALRAPATSGRTVFAATF